MNVFLFKDRLSLEYGDNARCPFCKMKLVDTNHKCVSRNRQNKLIRAVKKFQDLPLTVCSACKRPTTTESTDSPFFVKGELFWKHHKLVDNSVISTPPAPSVCAQCVYATREYLTLTTCSCGRISNIEKCVQPIPTGPVQPTKNAPAYATKTGGLCAACNPLHIPKPCIVEKPVQTLVHPEGTHICFICYSIGDWPSYFPVPSQYLFQRYHFLKRAPKFICSKCIKQCRFCAKPALGKDEVCSSCYSLTVSSKRTR